MKVDSDNTKDAIKIAKDNFQDLELTSEWLDSRDVSFEEVDLKTVGKQVAKMFSAKVDKTGLFENMAEFTCRVFSDNDMATYVYEEAVSSLKEDYNIYPNKIDI